MLPSQLATASRPVSLRTLVIDTCKFEVFNDWMAENDGAGSIHCKSSRLLALCSGGRSGSLILDDLLARCCRVLIGHIEVSDAGQVAIVASCGGGLLERGA